MFILLNKKKYESLCLGLLQFVLFTPPPPFIFTQPLVIYLYMSGTNVKSARLNTPLACHYVRIRIVSPS